jgi:acyl-CoA dehydrogenase
MAARPRSLNHVGCDWRSALEGLGPKLACNAGKHDADRRFVSENLDLLKPYGFFQAAVPAELGGGGCSQAELGEMLRSVASCCGSTALALSMHTHLVATLAWRWRHSNGAGAALLSRVVSEDLVLVSSGGSDWLDGSAMAVPVEGGYRITGRKVFASGAPGGDVLLTTGVLTDGVAEPLVLHFPVALNSAGVRLLDNWDTLGMRGTGSVDIELAEVFVAADTVTVRRPAGKWHESIHLTTKIAFPLIYAVYLGIAEAARQRALDLVARRKRGCEIEATVGEMETELAAAQVAFAEMIRLSEQGEVGAETSSRIMICRTLVARASIRTVEKAMEAAGGAGFYRQQGLERMFRDVQAARYHPLQEKPQARLAAQVALGLDLDGEA